MRPQLKPVHLTQKLRLKRRVATIRQLSLLQNRLMKLQLRNSQSPRLAQPLHSLRAIPALINKSSGNKAIAIGAAVVGKVIVHALAVVDKDGATLTLNSRMDNNRVTNEVMIVAQQ
jgi:hypothetical protein